MNKNLKPFPFIICSCILSFFCLIPWFILVPRGAILWIFVFIASVFDSVQKHDAQNGRLIQVLLKAYQVLFFFMLSGFTLFAIQIHPAAVVLLWLCALYATARLPFSFSLQLLHVCFILLIVFDTAVFPLFQSLEKYSGVAVVVRSGTVRNIFTDEAEKYLFFTAYSKIARRGRPYETFFRVSLANKQPVKSLIYPFCYSGVYDNKRHVIYLLSRDTHELLVVSPESLKILRKVEINKYPADIYVDEKADRLIILFEWSMALYDPASLRKTLGITKRTGANFVQGILLKKHHEFYTACFTMGGVQQRDLRTCRIKRKIHNQLTPWALASDRGEHLLYFTDFLRGTLSVAGRNTFRVIKSIRLKSGVRAVEVDDRRGLIYVGSFLNPYLIILNKDLKIIGRAYVGNPCRDIKLLKNGRLFAATNLGLLEINVDRILKALLSS